MLIFILLQLSKLHGGGRLKAVKSARPNLHSELKARALSPLFASNKVHNTNTNTHTL